MDIKDFKSGTQRIGRLLITLYLVSNGILEKPLLYLSDFFEKHKTLYYDNLAFVRTKNDRAMTNLSHKAASGLVQAFTTIGILKETTGYQRNKVFVFDEYVKMF